MTLPLQLKPYQPYFSGSTMSTKESQQAYTGLKNYLTVHMRSLEESATFNKVDIGRIFILIYHS